ncbi:MAG: radical SAM protein, partial [Clostridia bacterium]|nr:radical SAM protein [Clostridia bacterium]
ERYMQDVTRIFTETNPHLREFSLEAGRPDSITPRKMEIAKISGVTRMSVNPQTMQDETLKLIGRHHTAAQIVEAFQMAREAGMENINMDVIARLPGEKLEHFTRTLSAIRELKPDGITVHTLSVKRAADLKRDEKRAMLENVQVGEMVACARQVCGEMGMHPFYMYRQKICWVTTRMRLTACRGKKVPIISILWKKIRPFWPLVPAAFPNVWRETGSSVPSM